jgi:hypothetical protein
MMTTRQHVEGTHVFREGRVASPGGQTCFSIVLLETLLCFFSSSVACVGANISICHR